MNPLTAFDEILARHRERLGGSVSLDELFDLHDASVGSGSLSEEERVALLDRVAADPEAARKLLALVRFPETTEAEDAEGVEERWLAFRDQLSSSDEPGATDQPVRVDQRVDRFPSRSRPSRRRVVGLAASLVLVSALVVWFGRTQGPEASRGATEGGVWINTPVVELTAGGATHRGAERIAWPSHAQALVLALSTDDEVVARRSLSLAIVDGDGALISRSSGLEPDAAGLYFVTLHRDVIEPGLYEIQLRDDRKVVLVSFPVEIHSTP